MTRDVDPTTETDTAASWRPLAAVTTGGGERSQLTEQYTVFERIERVVATDHGLVAHLHGELLRIDVVADDVARIRISRNGIIDESPTYAVGVDPLDESPSFAFEIDDDVVRLRTEAMTVSLWLDPFRLDVHRADQSPVVETARDAAGRYWAYATTGADGAFMIRRVCQPRDAIYGLGQKAGRGNRNGREYTMWNTDVMSPEASREFTRHRTATDPRADPTGVEFDPYYISIPFFYHHADDGGAMAGSFIDNVRRSHYDFTTSGFYSVRFAGGQYTEYIFAGPEMPRILDAYTRLTGRIPLPPLWSLGYHQCRWLDYTHHDVAKLAARHRDRNIPCDALWLDIDHMDGYRVFTWNPELFPDPAAMLDQLSDMGFRTITIIDPGVKYEPGYRVFDQALERGLLCRSSDGSIYIGHIWPGDTAFPDFTLDETRSWWGELNAAHIESGLAGIWNDMNEPATGAIPPTQMFFGRGEHPHGEFHNQYALLMAMATSAGLLAARPDQRTFILSRAGSAGIQRYAANWTGDNQATWDHLWLSIPMSNGLGISGQPFVGADVGGFQGDSSAELLLRWMQHGTLTPFCRNHNDVHRVDQYAWSWGDDVEDAIRAAIQLRYRLLPYIYVCFLRASETGAPIQRPLVFDHQDDPAVRDIDDEYLLGPDLLVAPVLEAGVIARRVYLPNADWYDWHTDEFQPGGRRIVGPAPRDRIPIYARAGAVIPMWPTAPPSTRDHHPKVIELHLFVPTSDAPYTSFLQEDDGLTFAALDGRRFRTLFRVTRTGRTVTMHIQVDGAGYAEFAREEFHLFIHGADPPAIQLDGNEVRASGGRFTLPNSDSPPLITFRV